MKTIDEWYGEIHVAIKELKKESKSCGELVTYDFNGVTLVIDRDSDDKLIYRDWYRGLSGYLGKNPTVGPYPKAELSAEEMKSDARIESDNQKRRDEATAKYEREQEQKRLFLKGVLLSTGPLELRDEAAWGKYVEVNASNPYSKACVDYAETWGRVMQARIAAGCSLEEIASESSQVADVDGITGFMYGCAVKMLADCWIHGAQLRRWHNKDTQIGTEGDTANETGGVLNLALLSIQ